ncbi:uncharacterized protein B0H18DRAFT_1116648 [Fomitopsis serialis]|uniref:uncharacterized protein n=1 Tax=Fomitopsis serialis TaxID=139415 RepID=UPI002007E118|nr:uncharacterized protein B0H18DRAFT_1116648 [Neoantrodia serialis]KAH9930948.1 hypothetical protein B0H18DRAFT_1116648 [Neoantrodia serialis]
MKGPSFLLVLVVLLGALLMAAARPIPVEGVRQKKALRQFQMKRGQPGGAIRRLYARASPSPSPRPSPSPSRKYVAPAIRTEAPRAANPDLLGVLDRRATISPSE